ncbi:Mannose-binding lectin [Fusarium austroafricanum]|uniref:Mannose-binding lectin n=1 Tax=Fusarium austroafricanum TaxID=2364996 RepID=A0A8H4KCA0_9HYPO|nr:Mannose-binding lectin [Fusarium austroafricanum]
MALLLAPYTNAMRLGQGFNSYTQQICVDDAVVIDPNRAENIVTNDGTTMRIVAELTGKPSAWNRIKEVVKEGPIAGPELADGNEDITNDSSSKAEIELPKQALAAIEGTKLASGSSEAPPEEKTTDSDKPEVGKDEAPVSKDAPPEESGEPEKAQASESDSLVEVDPTEAAIPAAANPKNTQASPDEAEASSTSPVAVEKATNTEKDETAEKETKAEKEVAKTGTSTAYSSRNRSSSVGNKQSTETTALAVRKPSKYQVKEIPSRQAPKGVITAPQKLDELAAEEAKKQELLQEEKKRMAEQRAYQRELEAERRKEQTLIRQEELKEQQEIRAEKRAFEKERREAARKAINEAAAARKEPLTLEELNNIKAQNQFADRFDGVMQGDKKFYFDPTTGNGTSQTVTYSSKFIDKLSDITEDMCISGALSVKMAKIGGSGRGSFVDSDKFKESDLSFYISVKVVNQTVNFKDALEFNKLRSVPINSDDFNKVYGDSFISGFVEGGEFNALVSMKVHNKAKLLDIKAEAKVALTTGPVDITAEANVGIARTNLEMNTETTIQVSWCGGGVIKPMDQPWNIQSIMEAAARFPELVSHCPQRTYAVLTKYDTLRSFVSQRPASFSPLQYENAQMYTNVLMDAFMTYKSIYKKIGDQSFSIQNKTLEFEPVDPAQVEADKNAAIEAAAKDTPLMAELKRKIDSKHPRAAEAQQYLTALQCAADISRFEPSMKGISDARKFIRRQMVYIVNEVDLIENDPKIATDQDHEEPFQPPLMFEDRLPVTRIPDRLKPKSDPLSGRRIMAKTQTETELKAEQKAQEEADAESPRLYTQDQDLTTDETASMDKIREKYPGIGRNLRVSTAVPKTEAGVLFNNLDFLFPEWQVEHITIGIAMGRVFSIEIKYDNGLILQKGVAAPDMKFKTLKDFQSGERITSVAIEVGEVTSGGTGERVLSICMYTTRGRRLLGQAVRNEVLPEELVRKDNVEYKKAHTTFIDAAFSSGSLKGFFGRLDMDPSTGGLLRVGVIWGANVTSKPTLTTTVQEVAPIYDTDESSTAATIETFRGQVRAAEEQVRAIQAELSAAQERERLLNEKKSQLEGTIQSLDSDKQRENQRANTAENACKDVQDRLEKERQIMIPAITYGWKNYTANQKIQNKIRDYVINRQPITLSNAFFEEDPAPGIPKVGAVVVQSIEKDKQEELVGGEGTTHTFFL